MNRTRITNPKRSKPSVKVQPKAGSFKSRANQLTEKPSLVGIGKLLENSSLKESGNTNFSDYTLDKMTLI